MNRRGLILALAAGLLVGCGGDEPGTRRYFGSAPFVQWNDVGVARFVDEENGCVIYIADKYGKNVSIAVWPRNTNTKTPATP